MKAISASLRRATRRHLMRWGGSAIALAAAAWAPAAHAGMCDQVSAIALVNGKILTVAGKNSIASAVRIIDNKIVQVGSDPGPRPACMT